MQYVSFTDRRIKAGLNAKISCLPNMEILKNLEKKNGDIEEIRKYFGFPNLILADTKEFRTRLTKGIILTLSPY